jgi:hypothetical protein
MRKKRIHGSRLLLSAGTAIALVIGMLAGGPAVYAAGPTSVGLGTADSFAILAGTGITNTGPTTISGDVGSYATTSETGFAACPAADCVTLTGTNHAGDAVTQGAKSALSTAFDTAFGKGPVTTTTHLLGGQTLVAGVYNAGGFTLDLTGTLTLDGQGDANSVWVFQGTSDLVTASASSVSFINGGQPCNVFWQVTSTATLGSGSSFAGTILALTSITMAAGVTLNGRALARNGSVTLINDTISRPTCASTRTAAPTSTIGGGSSSSSTPPFALLIFALTGLLLATVVVQRRSIRS